MNSLFPFLIGAVKITLLDIVLSGDNVGLIALATKDLPEKYAKKASFFGITAAIGLRIIFAALITFILKIQWLPIKLVGGLILVKITWDLMKGTEDSQSESVRSADKFWSSVLNIVIADATMSLDNVLAIGSAANGHILLIVIGLAINIPIIFCGSRFVSKLMNKYPIVMYIGGGVLAHTSFKMILEDKLMGTLINGYPAVIIPYAAALLVVLYGIVIIIRSNKSGYHNT